MSESFAPISPIRKSTGFRLLVLFSLMFVALLIVAALSAWLQGGAWLGGRDALLLSSALQCLVAFCLPSFITARFATDRPLRFLGLTERVTFRPFAGVAIVYILAMPAMNWLIDWNESVHFPESAAGLEQTLRAWEANSAEITGEILSVTGVAAMLSGVAVVGLLTGFSEELFFRGAMQTVFKDSGVAPGIAVWGAAFIFSAVHFQFFGFFPRLLMGAFFGYLFVWSGSLWPGVFAHALNNSIVVVGEWLSACGADSGSAALSAIGTASSGGYPYAALSSVAATACFFFFFRNYFFKKDLPLHHG